MSTARVIEPELLDDLAPDDPRAIRARRDLARVNAVMGHRRIWNNIMQAVFSPDRPPTSIAELGAGDGTLLLRLARTWASRWPHVKVYLIDRHTAVAEPTIRECAELGWQVEVETADVTEWITTMPSVSLVMANLFLHHFNDTQLTALLQRIAGKTGVFAACEPRRTGVALVGSHLLGLIGCGPVTRYDAVVSVRAGFSGNELAALWPVKRGWQLQEGRAGLFTHTFMAQRVPVIGT